MKAGATDNIPLAHRLADFLLSYRSTPHSSTGRSPSYLFLHRELRTRLDLLRPSVANKVLDSQSSQSCQHDKHARLRTFHIGQLIWAKDFLSKNWIKGVIVEQRGPYTFLIRTESNLFWRKHVDQIRDRATTTEAVIQPPTSSDDAYLLSEQPSKPVESHVPAVPRYPQRDRHPPDRFRY